MVVRWPSPHMEHYRTCNNEELKHTYQN
jgi:hypothetical protein